MMDEVENFRKTVLGLAHDKRIIADLDILGQKIGFSALCPGHTGPLPRKQILFGI